MSKVFICYRRSDNAALTTRLYDALAIRFGGSQVFFDQQSIAPAEAFRPKIASSIVTSDIVAVVIGPLWQYDASGADQLHEPKDYVRFEIETALKNKRRVLPILLEGASVPNPSTLPDSIRLLAQLHAATLRGDTNNFIADCQKIIEAVAVVGPLYESYIPMESSNFIEWLQNFLRRCNDYLGQYGIDHSLIEIVATAKRNLETAEADVARASDAVALAQQEYDDATLAAGKAKERLNSAQLRLAQTQSESKQAVYMALREVQPQSEKVRTHGNIGENQRKEFGISGQFAATQIRLVPPTAVTATPHLLTKMMIAQSRTDTITWEDMTNPPGTIYAVEAVAGALNTRGNLTWNEEKVLELGTTPEKRLVKTWTKPDFKTPFKYRVRCLFQGAQSSESEFAVARP